MPITDLKHMSVSFAIELNSIFVCLSINMCENICISILCSKRIKFSCIYTYVELLMKVELKINKK